MRTVSDLPFNISRKVAYTIVSGAVSWALARYAVGLDPDVAVAITGLVGGLFGYVADPDEQVPA